MAIRDLNFILGVRPALIRSNGVVPEPGPADPGTPDTLPLEPSTPLFGSVVESQPSDTE
ncbi:MAG: hypothetical protein RLN62_05530 [Rickettsiales bacterium]